MSRAEAKQAEDFLRGQWFFQMPLVRKFPSCRQVRHGYVKYKGLWFTRRALRRARKEIKRIRRSSDRAERWIVAGTGHRFVSQFQRVKDVEVLGAFFTRIRAIEAYYAGEVAR